MTLTFANDGGAADAAAAARGPAQGPPPIRTAPAAPAAGGGGRGGGLFSGTRRQRHADRRSGDAARALLARRAARRQLQAALRRSARRLRRPQLRRLQRADRRADGACATSAAIAWRRRTRRRAISEPVKPIQYWVDPGAPEDVRKALRRRRELVEPGVRSRRLPQRVQGRRAARRRRPDGHPLQHDQLGPPLDARLEHRAARSADPRTGEIIKATVTLGSLRDRQDYLIFEGLLSPYTTGNEKPDDPLPDRAQAHPPARGARGRPHARPRPQLLRQHQGLDLGDGLSAPAREAERATARSTLRRLPGSASATGTRSRSTTATASSRRAPTRRPRSPRSSTTPGRRTCAT